MTASLLHSGKVGRGKDGGSKVGIIGAALAATVAIALGAGSAGSVRADDATAPLQEAAPPPLEPAPPPLEPVPPPLPEIRYFVDEAGIAGGPYVIAELQARVASGALRPETRVWTAGMPAWAPASSVAALAPLLAAAPPPPPAAPAFDIERFIVGHWQQEGPVTMHGGAHGTHRTTVEFKADRSWAVYGNSNMSSHLGTFQTVLTGQGTYTLNPAPGSQFELRINGMFSNDIVGFAHDGSTSEYKTAIRFSIVDQNTIRSEDGTISRRIGP